MKKLATLILAAGLVLGVSTGASAVDFKAKGEWNVSFDLGQNGNFSNHATGWGKGGEDQFEVKQRFRTDFEAVASEALSGTLKFEIGRLFWGKGQQYSTIKNNGGGALGADANAVIKLRGAYLDWLVPQTDLKIRMGVQGMALPSFTTTSMVFNDDVAGITASYKFNENVGITAVWARPYNDNYTKDGDVFHSTKSGYLDNVDAFGLLIPLTFDGIKVTPWAMYAALGPNWNNYNKTGSASLSTTATSYAPTTSGMFPAYGALHKDGDGALNERKLVSYGEAWWFGLTGEVTVLDPFRISWDFNYGSVTWRDDGRLNRQGWLASLLLEYKLDWGVPGIYGWYASGDDSNPSNGSERLPYVSVGNSANGFSYFAGNGATWDHSREAVLTQNWNGTWGIGARLKDFSFVEDLKHTFWINLIGGTNSPAMAKKLVRQQDFAANAGTGGRAGYATTPLGVDPLYMTTLDSALEIGLRNVYQIYENLQLYFEGAYIATWLNKGNGVWGKSDMNGRGSSVTKDPWNINMTFVYQF
jgi:hypothetical protein